jgi:hypothetical protein
MLPLLVTIANTFLVIASVVTLLSILFICLSELGSPCGMVLQPELLDNPELANSTIASEEGNLEDTPEITLPNDVWRTILDIVDDSPSDVNITQSATNLPKLLYLGCVTKQLFELSNKVIRDKVAFRKICLRAPRAGRKFDDIQILRYSVRAGEQPPYTNLETAISLLTNLQNLFVDFQLPYWRLGKHTQLTRLVMMGNPWDSPDRHLFCRSPVCPIPSLRVLKANEAPPKLKLWTNLRKLEIYDAYKLVDSCVLTHLTNLVTFKLWNGELLEHTALSRLTNLTSLCLTDEMTTSALQSLPKLAKLSFAPEMLKTPLFFADLTNLERIDFNSIIVTCHELSGMFKLTRLKNFLPLTTDFELLPPSLQQVSLSKEYKRWNPYSFDTKVKQLETQLGVDCAFQVLK